MIKAKNKVFIWFASIVLLCICASCLGLLGGGAGSVTPHANIQIVIQPSSTTEQTIDQAEETILSLNYIKQPPNPSRYADNDERSYKKGNFEISYFPETGESKRLALWLHFYEHGSYQFSNGGLEEYQSLIDVIATAGLEQSLENDPRFPGRTILTTEMFNTKQNRPIMVISRMASLPFVVAVLAVYGAIVFWPGFWISIKLIRRLSVSNTLKRILFVVGSSVLLAPGLILLTPFGPALLVPLPLAIPFALAAEPLFYFLAISFVCTLFLASLVSLLIKNPILLGQK